MLAKYLITSLFLISSLLSLQAEAEYHRVAAKNGDGVYSLLRRYQLDGYACNFNQFYELNKLGSNASLVKGRKYYLPILIYDYDGKSIRSTLGISDWDQAVRIRDYNNEILSKRLRQQTYAKSRILWVPHHELYCQEGQTVDIPTPKAEEEQEEAPTISQEEETTEIESPPVVEVASLKDKDLATTKAASRTFPIFGAKYAYTPLISNALAGKVFYVVAGHGGPDPGAVGKRAGYQLCEDEYAYDVALRFCRNLIAHGATAYMITRDPNDGIRSDMYLDCDKDEVVWGNKKMYRNQKARLTQRTDVINDLYKKNKWKGVQEQTVIVIHVDSRSKGQAVDLFFYHHPASKAGKKIAQQLHQTMKSKYQKYRASGEYHGTVTARDLHMLRESKPNTVYIELGNISHYRDQQRIILEDNRQALANWLVEGLMK